MKEQRALLIFPRQYQMGYMKLKRDYQARRYPPLGLMYISSSLKKIGIDTDLIDMTANDILPEDIVKILSLKNYLFVGFYADTTTRYSVLEYIKLIREHRNITILIGGPSSLEPLFFLSDEGIIVVHGEGEQIVEEISKSLIEKKDFSHLKGISYKQNGSVYSERTRLLIDNLDSIAFPDRTAIDMNKYHDYYNLNYRGPFATIITSRGCPTNCSYCSSSNLWGRQVRFRSIANVREEIKYIKSKYHVRYIDFVDDIFNLNKKWLDGFCETLISERLRINWSCNMYPFDMPFELLKKVKLAGGNTIKLGLQSADSTVLNNIHRRPETVENARKFIRDAKKLGFIIFMDFIFGLPGDTKESIYKNINFAVDENPQITKFYKLNILEGSEIYYDSLKNIKITDLPQELIDKYCKIGWRKFYFRPIKMFDFLVMYFKNPFIIIKILRHLNIFRSFID